MSKQTKNKLAIVFSLLLLIVMFGTSCITVYKNSNVSNEKNKTILTDSLIIKRSLFGK